MIKFHWIYRVVLIENIFCWIKNTNLFRCSFSTKFKSKLTIVTNMLKYSGSVMIFFKFEYEFESCNWTALSEKFNDVSLRTVTINFYVTSFKFQWNRIIKYPPIYVTFHSKKFLCISGNLWLVVFGSIWLLTLDLKFI